MTFCICVRNVMLRSRNAKVDRHHWKHYSGLHDIVCALSTWILSFIWSRHSGCSQHHPQQHQSRKLLLLQGVPQAFRAFLIPRANWLWVQIFGSHVTPAVLQRRGHLLHSGPDHLVEIQELRQPCSKQRVAHEVQPVSGRSWHFTCHGSDPFCCFYAEWESFRRTNELATGKGFWCGGGGQTTATSFPFLCQGRAYVEHPELFDWNFVAIRHHLGQFGAQIPCYIARSSTSESVCQSVDLFEKQGQDYANQWSRKHC